MGERFRSDVEKNLFRIPVSIDKKTNDWLYNLGVSMKISGGYKLPKTYIIRSLINGFRRLRINFKNIRSEKDLEKRIFQSLRMSQRMNRPNRIYQMRNQDRNLLVANIGMNVKQISFIDKIAREIRFSGGGKPSRSSIVMIFIKIAMLLKLDLSSIRSEKEFEQRVFQSFLVKNSKKTIERLLAR